MKLWNGRFEKGLNPEAMAFSSSLSVDKRLYKEDIEGSLAHAKMLAKQKIISRSEANTIQKALKEIEKEIDTGKFSLTNLLHSRKRFVAEDIHMAIEHRLIQKICELGGKLHTARSRNDQIALDERLYLRKAIRKIETGLRRFQKSLLAKSEKYIAVVMPGYTHLQRAQPILFSHHLLAYVSMLDRDYERFQDCLKRVNLMPLGAAALAGTSFPIDRKFTAKQLHFVNVLENSIDAVSDRDVQIEFISACAITMMHLSRFAEEIILWNSKEWNFIEIGDAFTTGSSIMPQKKNPDVAELIRGKTGGIYGNLMTLLTIMKSLPLAYNRDMQEDKQPIFNSADTTTECLTIAALMLNSIKLNAARFENEMQTDFLLSTELADYLVRKGMPFRKAHSIIGKIVHLCILKNISLKELPLKEYQKQSKLFQRDALQTLDIRSSLKNKKSSGSTSPIEVKYSIRKWKKKLKWQN